MSRSVYVLAVVGESPAVLSELLWWLVERERRYLAGIEVWATEGGAARLRAQVARWVFAAPMPPLAPEGAQPESGAGFRIHVLGGPDGPIEDVQTEAECAAVSARLHDRVQALRSELSDAIQLVGSIAGGRKTTSAALQTAFCLQAGAQDRLMHVVLEARTEAWLKREGRLEDFVAPSQEWAELTGVPIDEQLVLVEVPFPRLRLLVPRRLAEALDGKSWREVWPVLDANMGRDAEGVLARVGSRWRFAVVDRGSGEEVWKTGMSGRAGAVFAAMVALSAEGAEPDAMALVRWLDEQDVGWRAPKTRGTTDEDRALAVRNAVAAVRKALAELPMGLERFAPAAKGFRTGGVRVIPG